MNYKKDINAAKKSVKKMERSGEWAEKFSNCLIDAGNWKSFIECLKAESREKRY